MKNLQSSLAMKLIAFVLLVLAATAAATSGILLIYGYDQGIYGKQDWYDENGVRQDADGTYYHSVLCRNEAQQSASHVADMYHNGEDVKKIFAGDYYSFDFSLREADKNGRLLASTILPDSSYGRRYTTTQGFSEDIYDELSGEVINTDMTEYYIEIAVTDPLRGTDGFYQDYQLFLLLQRVRSALVPVLVGALVLTLALLIFLFSAAGHKKGREGITLNWLDRIPVDLYALILGFGTFFSLSFAVESGYNIYYNYLINWAVAIALLVPAGIFAMGLLLSLATRFKAGNWWRNSVIYILIHFLLRNGKRVWMLLGKMVHALPMVWRTFLITGGILVVVAYLGVCGYWGGFWLFLCFLFCLCVLVGVCFGAWQLRKLQKAGQALAAGEMETKLDTRHMYFDFKRHAENLNAIGDGMAVAVEQRMRSERLKTELITNVSHDIKTPLTSIVNYVDLLQKPHTEEEQAQYLEVLQRQSARLKKLTEDLVEASKASTGNVSTSLVRTNVIEIVNQALGEYAERLTAGNLTVVTDLPDGEVAVKADGRLLWRILDNLLSNVCKYAMAGTRVYVSVRTDGETVIAVKNISRQPLNVSADELMERFVRGDAARSTEGSGLGLNIARSLTELQGGTFTLFVDGDFFRAEIRMPIL